MLRVGYDAQAFLSPNGGTGKGLQLRNLLGPYLDRFIGFASSGPNPSGLPLVQDGPASYQLWHQLWLPWRLLGHRIDLFLAPYNTAPVLLPPRTRLVLVLHDTILSKGFRNPDRKSRWMDLYRRCLIPLSVRRASFVLTVSEHARAEIQAKYPKADVRVIPCSIPEHWFAPRPLTGRAGHLLMVTSSAPHKNVPGALAAYARYTRRAGARAQPLKIVGLAKEAGSFRAMIDELGIRELVTLLPFLPEAELLSLYQNASALFFPSFAEGFGIPMLEAMATGTPVIAAGATSLPEVGGDAAYYFDPSSIEEMADALGTVLDDQALRTQMAGRGLLRAELFHPAVVARQVAVFWQQVAGARIKAAARSPLETPLEAQPAMSGPAA